MKTKHYLLLLPILLLGFTACKKVFCARIECEHGTCTGTECACEEGWEKDADGRCTVAAYICDNTICVHGTCNTLWCDCDPGWRQDANGHCTIAEPCYNVDCDHGHCNGIDGSCVCDIYYMIGTDGKCSKTWGQNLAGTWRGTHQIVFGGIVGPYEMVISADPSDPNHVSISNYGNETCSTTGLPLVVAATVGSPTSLIANQSLCTGVTSGGSMHLVNDSTITVDGSLTINSTLLSWDGVFVRQ